MKYISQHWGSKDEGVLFFFQRLEEMLFHYSDDIVRVPVHNTKTLLEEYLKNERDNQEGKVKSYQLEQILDELSNNIQADKILREKLGEEFVVEISNSIKKDKGDGIRYLYHKISGSTYQNWSTQYLKEHVRQHNHKSEIEFGLRSWITGLLFYGYSPEYIYTYLRERLAATITEPNKTLEEFLDHFNLEKNNYRVYFSFSPALIKHKQLFSARMQIHFESDEYFKQSQRRKKDFIGYVQIEDLDRYKAAEHAYKKISTFIKYYRVISNRRQELVRRVATVKKEGENQAYDVPVKPNGYRSIELEPKVNIESTVDTIIIECQKKEQQTYLRLGKMFDLHNAAIGQHDLNDGFLNLWSILEIVSASIGNESKIGKVIEGVLPILQKDYFHVVFENLNQDLIDNLSHQDYIDLISKLKESGSSDNYISRFVFLPEFEKLREEYFEKLSAYPIIRQKIYVLWEMRNSKVKIWGLSNRYAQRVKWHIYRLYRTRNAIVHSGESDIKIQALGEHLHIYVDRILGELLVKLAKEKTLKTISDVLIDTSFSLEKTKKCFNEDVPVSAIDLKILENDYFYSTTNNEAE